MWDSFALSLFVAVVFVYLPGFVLLKALRVSAFFGFVCAPIPSLFEYLLLSITLPSLGISCGWALLFGSALIVNAVLALTLGLARRQKHAGLSSLQSGDSGLAVSKGRWVLLACYVLFSIAIYIVVFLRFFPDAGYSIQGYDTVFHLATVQSFLASADYSPLTVSIYDGVTWPSPYSDDGSFYPALWHIVCSMVADACEASVPVVANAVNMLFGTVVFPLGMMAMILAIFPKSDSAIWFGSILAVAFSSFPWAILVRGEQYAQFSAFCLIPLVCFIFCRMIGARSVAFGWRVSVAAVFLMGLVDLAFAQPNAVFTVALFGACFLTSCLYRYAKLAEGRERSRRYLLVACFLLFVVVVWTLLYKAPFMSGAVTYSWDSFASISQAATNVLVFSLNEGFVPQIPLAFLTGVGAVFCLFRKGEIWPVALCLITAVMYVVNVSTDGFLKHYLTGFWYTDPDRICAVFSIFAVPLAASGASCLTKGLKALVFYKMSAGSFRNTALTLFAAFAIAVGIYFPSWSLNGIGTYVSGIGQIEDKIFTLTSADFVSILDKREQAFVDDIAGYLQEGAPVINIPSDGSAFLYGLYDYDVYYRRNSGDTRESELIRLKLCDIAADEEVANAVEEIGAKYVLVLDREGVFHDYKDEEWFGIASIADDTPGFKTIARDGDMALFEIVV